MTRRRVQDLTLAEHCHLAMTSYAGSLERRQIAVPDDLHRIVRRLADQLDAKRSGAVIDRGADQAGRDAGWLSIKAAAHHTGLSESTIRRAISSGALASARVGRSRRISREVLTTYMTIR